MRDRGCGLKVSKCRLRAFSLALTKFQSRKYLQEGTWTAALPFSLTPHAATPNPNQAVPASTRIAHSNPTRLSSFPNAMANTAPPTPLPLYTMPKAIPLLLANHCAASAFVDQKRRAYATPNVPCARNKVQTGAEKVKDVPSCPAPARAAPAKATRLAP